MNKMWKSFIALGLTSCMLIGCGQNVSKEESVVKDDKTNENTESSSSEVLEEEGTYPDYLNLDSQRPIIKEGENITLSAVVCTSGDVNAGEDLWFWSFVEQVLNIDMEIEVVSAAALEENKSLMLASGDLPDIIYGMGITKSDIVKYGVEEGMFLPVSDWISEELTPNLKNVVADFPDEIKASTAPDGKVYCIPSINTGSVSSYDKFGVETTFIYTPYLNAIGLEASPTTLDEFVDMMRAFKKLDPGKFGVDEIYPMLNVGDNFEKYLKTAFGWVNSLDAYTPVWDAAENEVAVPCMQEKYGDYIRLLNTLYSEGLMHQDYYTMESDTARAYAAEKKVAVWTETPYVAYPDDFANFVGAAPLTSEWCEVPVSGRGNTFTDGSIFIAADTEYPEVCMRLLDYINSPEGGMYESFGPMEGSEDLLGMIEGWHLNEAGSWIVYNDLAGYTDEGSYRLSKVSASGTISDIGPYRQEYMKEITGGGYSPATEFNMSDPVIHWRKLLYDVQKDYLVPTLKEAFMSAAQNESYTDLFTVISEYVDSETAKFVVGQRPLDEIDAFLDEVKAMGGEEYLKLCKELYSNY